MFLSFLFLIVMAGAQSSPWLSPVKICSGTSATSFGTSSIFQDSSGVATITRVGSSNSDTLIAAFQWFPMPMGNPKWDKVAVKFSYNGGSTWTTPTTCTFVGLPVNFQRPFDPALIQMPNGQMRMYFSDGVSNPGPGGIDTYSGLSDDGITYTIEPTAKFDDPTRNAIDPSVGFFNGTYYYNSWTANQNDGANRASSADAITYTTQAVFPYDNIHLWLGNYMTDGSTFRFYGCGNGMWMNSTTDGVTWNGYNNIGIMGADPAVVKNKSGTYIMLYTGPPSSTGIEEYKKSEIMTIYPIVFSNNITINPVKKLNYDLQVIDALGRIVYEENNISGSSTQNINLETLKGGVYYCMVRQESETVVKKIIKTE